jgi:hypothetical protein
MVWRAWEAKLISAEGVAEKIAHLGRIGASAFHSLQEGGGAETLGFCIPMECSPHRCFHYSPDVPYVRIFCFGS